MHFCSIDNCNRRYSANGMCTLHYDRLRRGYPLYAPTTELERFLDKVNLPNNSGCTEWKGYKNKKGYGQVHIGGRRGKVIAAHRYSYQMFVGPIPDGFLVCHKCDNPPCVNPMHLFVGTDKDNSDDKHSKARANMPSKEGHGMAKLTVEQISMIRQRYSEDNISQCALAKIFNTTQSNIWYILQNRTWIN